MTLDEAIEYHIKVATQRAIADEEMGVNDKWNETKFMTKKESEQIIADNRQLAEWLTDYKELKNSIGAAKFSNMKEALELIREYKAENIAQKKLIAEYKRLLKSAVEGFNLLGNYLDDNCPINVNCIICPLHRDINCKCWKHQDEALALIGEDGAENDS